MVSLQHVVSLNAVQDLGMQKYEYQEMPDFPVLELTALL